jgi:hypothetical protein
MVHAEIDNLDETAATGDMYLNAVSPVKRSQVRAIPDWESHRHGRHTDFPDGSVRDGEAISSAVNVLYPRAGQGPICEGLRDIRRIGDESGRLFRARPHFRFRPTLIGRYAASTR